MLEEVNQYESLLTQYLEVDDLQGVEIVLAAAASHKLKWGEMLWLRVIGPSGSGKTELLRSLLLQEPFTTPLERITPGSIHRGWVDPKEKLKPKLLERLNGKLAITKEYSSVLTQEYKVQEQIFGLLRAVYDGTLDSDFGSAQGYFHQESFFDWVLGSASIIEKSRSLEYWLGTRFLDLRWRSPNDRLTAVKKARENVQGNILNIFRGKLGRAMANILDVLPTEHELISLPYLDELSNIVGILRSPVERNRYNREVEELPEKELATRMGQWLTRIATGLSMLGVEEKDMRPYMLRLVFDSMTRLRATIIKAWVDGLRRQEDIRTRADNVSQGTISRAIQDMQILGWQDEWLDILGGNGGGAIPPREPQILEAEHEITPDEVAIEHRYKTKETFMKGAE